MQRNRKPKSQSPPQKHEIPQDKKEHRTKMSGKIPSVHSTVTSRKAQTLLVWSIDGEEELLYCI